MLSLVGSVALSAAVTVAQASPISDPDDACTDNGGSPKTWTCSIHRHEEDGSCTPGTLPSVSNGAYSSGSWDDNLADGFEAGPCHEESEPDVCDNPEADNYEEEGECVFTRINICHADQNEDSPYGNSADNLAVAAVANGHMGHTGPVYFAGIEEAWGDIIPPFTYKGVEYSLNWNTEGQAIWNNGCQLPGDGGDPILGCTDPLAINYNEEAEQDDESCAYFGTGLDEACLQTYFEVSNPADSGVNPGQISFEIYDSSNTMVKAGSFFLNPGNNIFIAVDSPVVGETYTIYVWIGAAGAQGDANASQTSSVVEDCPSVVVSLTDPSELVCEEVTFVIENDGQVEIALVTWQIYNSDNNLVDSGTINNFAAGAQLEVLVENATPGLTYTLYAWIGAADELDNADSSETSAEVEECEEPSDPGDPEITTTLIPVTGAPVSGVLIPVTGFDAAGQAAFLASMAANMGFGSLGAGMLLHGLSLRKSKKDK